ncbi:MAG: hypothetical protein HC924_09575 [Synechococcaceae cyanobacterium SM2_3_2]|nr:hypothetical protein [Synechococcaceae cyanobacterium SM2_3_2]
MDPIVIGFVVVAIIVAMGWLRWRSGKAEMQTLNPPEFTSSGSTPVTGSPVLTRQLPSPAPVLGHKPPPASGIDSPATLAFLDEMEQRAKDAGDPAEEALSRVQALRHHMATTGGSLSDALRHRDGDKIPPQLPADLEQELRGYLQKGDKIEAIKRLRQATGSTLQAAKEGVERLTPISDR